MHRDDDEIALLQCKKFFERRPRTRSGIASPLYMALKMHKAMA